MKDLRDFIFLRKKIKYTCACCGYKTLLDNGPGELCPVCFWEEGYDDFDNLFGMSSTNYITLYQAQENYKKFGCCKKELLLHCRNPHKNEIKDAHWLSIQEKIEKETDLPGSLQKITELCEILRQVNADVMFANFNSLHEMDIINDFEFDEIMPDISHKLFLHALLLSISKKDLSLVKDLFCNYYKKGLEYYISWTIILIALIEHNEFQLNNNLTDLFLDIEINDFYGINSLEKALKEFWHRQKTKSL